MHILLKLVLLLVLITFTETSPFISVFLQKCYGTGNGKYCNFTTKCKPLNRTSKLSSTDVYFHPGVKLEAPIILEVIAYKKFRTEYRQHMVKVKMEMCTQLSRAHNQFFRILADVRINGNFLDPCPLTGHRYIKPQVSSYSYLPLVPVGEWRMDYIISKIMNKTTEVIFSWSDFYEIKPTGAEEF